jgi:hypothetical protein
MRGDKMLIGIILCLLVTIQFQVYAAVTNSSGGFIDVNVYPYLSDVDTDNTITINVGAKMNNRFSYFSLTNFGNEQGESALASITSFYTEQNVRWQISENSPIDLTIQMNFRSGDDNDRHRLGFRWRINETQVFKYAFNKINLSWSINFHVKQFDSMPEHIWQMEHVFSMTFPTFTRRLYLSGFIDQTFNENLSETMPKRPIVGEIQLGYRIIENLFLITEYRINEYRRSDVNNMAVGLEYLIKW